MPNVWPFSRARFATDDSSAELEHDFKMSQRFPPPKESALGRELTREDDPPLDSYDLERAPTTGTLDIGLPPDGGREAWLCVLSSLLVLFCIFGIATSFGQMALYYRSHQLAGYSKSTVAWLGSIQSMLTFLGSIYTGRFFDSHGPRLLVIGGTIMSVGALVALAFCQEYYQFLLSHILFGLSGTMVYSPATAISGHWFLRRRSTAVGVVVCGAGMGGVVYPVMLKKLFDAMSYRNSLLIVAGFNAVLMLPACLFMKARLPPRQPPPLRALAGPWHDTGYAFLVIGAGAYTLNVFTPYWNAPILTAANNLPLDIQDYSIAILQAGSFFGRVTAGVLADALGVWNVFGTLGFASAIVLFAFWTSTSIGTGATIAGLVLYGIFSGAWFTLVAAACAAISPVREIGLRLGMLWTCVGIPVLAGPVISGVLITADDNKFTHAGIFCGVTMLVAGCLMVGPRAWAKFSRKRASNRTASEGGESGESVIT